MDNSMNKMSDNFNSWKLFALTALFTAVIAVAFSFSDKTLTYAAILLLPILGLMTKGWKLYRQDQK